MIILLCVVADVGTVVNVFAVALECIICILLLLLFAFMWYAVQYGTLFFSLSFQYFSIIMMAYCAIVALITTEYIAAKYLKQNLTHLIKMYVLFWAF